MRSNVWGRWVVVCFENVLHHAGRATTKALFYLRQGELSTGEGRFFFANSVVYRLPKRRFSAVEQDAEISIDQFLMADESYPGYHRKHINKPSRHRIIFPRSKADTLDHDVETTSEYLVLLPQRQ